jgi:hypothetical protein
MPAYAVNIARMLPWMSIEDSPQMRAQQIRNAVLIVDNKHRSIVQERARLMLGADRAANVGPVDLTRNSLIVGVSRLNRAHEIPALIQDLSDSAATFCGDLSAVATIDRYRRLGGRPAPTPLIEAARETTRYQLAAGYAGLLVNYNQRRQRATFAAIAPDMLEPHYYGDDPADPTVIRHFRTRTVDGKDTVVADVYDLTDLERPAFRVEHLDGRPLPDLTRMALGKDAASGWPASWRDATGQPFHRIQIIGHPERVWRTFGATETTINVSIHRTSWGAASIDSGYPSRHVIGLVLHGTSTDSRTGQQGAASGPEVIHKWYHEDPTLPGSQFQWGPGFDPEAYGRAVNTYELTGLSATGLPVSFESLGGDPSEHEARAVEIALKQTYPEIRALYAGAIRAAVCQLNRIKPMGYEEQPEDLPGVMLREEIAEYEGIAKERAELAPPGVVADNEGTDDDASAPDDAMAAIVSTGAETLAETALNGAQVTAALTIVEKAANGLVPRDTAAEMLVQFFQLDEASVEKLLGSIGRTFTPAIPADPNA